MCGIEPEEHTQFLFVNNHLPILVWKFMLQKKMDRNFYRSTQSPVYGKTQLPFKKYLAHTQKTLPHLTLRFFKFWKPEIKEAAADTYAFDTRNFSPQKKSCKRVT